MTGVVETARIALAVALLLTALSLVAWRQSRAYEALFELDRIQREIEVSLAERTELMRRVQYLESRAHVVPAARERLEMHLPDASEIVYLEGAESAVRPPERTAGAWAGERTAAAQEDFRRRGTGSAEGAR